MKILATGAAGFIGMYTAKLLLEDGHEVAGLDSVILQFLSAQYTDKYDKRKSITNLISYCSCFSCSAECGL